MITGNLGPRTAGHPNGSSTRHRWDSDTLVLGVIAFAVFGFYLWVYPVKRIHDAVGFDAPVYVWWARRAAALGLSASNTGSRPITVALIAGVSGLLHVSPGAVIAAIEPFAALALGGGAGAALEIATAQRRWRLALTVFLTAIFAASLAFGYVANLLFGLFLCAGLALVLGRSTGRLDSVLAGALLAAAALSHPLLSPLIAAILGALLVPSDGAAGLRKALSGFRVRVVIAGATAIVLSGVGWILVRSASGAWLATSADALNRRAGLTQVVRSDYTRALGSVLLLLFEWVVGVVLLAGVAWTIRARVTGTLASDDPERSLAGARRLIAVGSTWTLVTLAGLALYVAGITLAAHRLLAFLIPVPVCLAVVAWAVGSRIEPGRPFVRIAFILAAVAPLTFVAARWWAPSNDFDALTSDARTAASALAATTPGARLAIVIQDAGTEPSTWAATVLNRVRDVVPANRVEDVALFLGRPADLVAGRPPLTGKEQYDRIAEVSWRVPAQKRNTVLGVVLRSADPRAFLEARSIPGSFQLGDGVRVLPVGVGRQLSARSASLAPNAEPRFSPWMPLWLTPVLLMGFALLGLPWARMLRHASLSIRLALAPPIGLLLFAAAAIATDRAGLRLETYGWVAGLLSALCAVVPLTPQLRRRKAASI